MFLCCLFVELLIFIVLARWLAGTTVSKQLLFQYTWNNTALPQCGLSVSVIELG